MTHSVNEDMTSVNKDGIAEHAQRNTLNHNKTRYKNLFQQIYFYYNITVEPRKSNLGLSASLLSSTMPPGIVLCQTSICVLGIVKSA